MINRPMPINGRSKIRDITERPSLNPLFETKIYNNMAPSGNVLLIIIQNYRKIQFKTIVIHIIK